MPGLLDGFMDDPSTMGLLGLAGGLLSAGGPSLMPHSLGQGLGAGLQGMQQAYNGTTQRLAEQQANAQNMQMNGLKIDSLKQQQAQQALSLAMQNRIKQRLMGGQGADQPALAGSPLQDTPASAMPGGPMSPKTGGPDWLQAYQQSQPAPMAQATPQAAPQAQGAPISGLGAQLTARLIREAQIRGEEGDVDGANKLYEQAAKFQPKVKNWQEVKSGGQVLYAPYFEDGTAGAPVPLEVARKLEFRDLGDRNVGVDPYSGKEVSTYGKGQSADSKASNALGWANFGLSKQRLANEKTQMDTPQYMDTQDGIVALPKKLAPGQAPTATPVMGANGQPLEKKQNVPQYVVEGVSGNAKALASIDAAIASLKTKDGKNSVGLKGYLPNGVLARVDPDGVDTRANISDVGSLVLHDRSGAAVTAAEAPRLMPFIPLASDDAETAIKKLTRMRQLTQAETDNLTFAYPSAKKLANYAAGNAPTPGQAAAPKKSAIPGQVSQGYRFKGGDPSDQSNWEKI